MEVEDFLKKHIEESAKEAQNRIIQRCNDLAFCSLFDGTHSLQTLQNPTERKKQIYAEYYGIT